MLAPPHVVPARSIRCRGTAASRAKRRPAGARHLWRRDGTHTGGSGNRRPTGSAAADRACLRRAQSTRQTRACAGAGCARAASVDGASDTPPEARRSARWPITEPRPSVVEQPGLWRVVSQIPDDRQLPLGVLRSLACALEAVLLALFDAWIARQEAGLAQRRLRLLVRAHQRPRHTMTHGTSLTAHAAARHLDAHVEATYQLQQPQRRPGLGEQALLLTEVHLRVAAIDRHRAITVRIEAHTGHGGLTPPRAIVVGLAVLRQLVPSGLSHHTAHGCVGDSAIS